MIYANQQEYYDAINASNNAGESTPFVEFMLDVIKASLMEVIEMRDEMRDEKSSGQTERGEQIEAYLKTHPYIMNSDVRKLCGISASTANRLLNSLVQSGRLIRYREGNHWAYRFPH